MFVGCCERGELWVQTQRVCFNLRKEEAAQILKHSRMQVAGVLLVPTVLSCACEFHGWWNWASPEMVPSWFYPTEREHCLRTVVCEQGALDIPRKGKISTSHQIVVRKSMGEGT